MKPEPNSKPESPDPLESLLRDADEYIEDRGFTARVLTRLPPRRRRISARTILLSAALLLGAALTGWLLPQTGVDLAAVVRNWSTWNLQTLLAVIPSLAVFGSLGWGLWALVKDEG